MTKNEKLAKSIEQAIKKRFGWKIKVMINNLQRGGKDFHWESASPKNRDRYDLYPGMTKREADDAIIRDIVTIIQEFLPNFHLSDYEQSDEKRFAQNNP
jgi:hypothetical protein